MAPSKQILQCKANRILVDRLQNDVDMYMELKRERLVITLRRAIHSIMECPNAIRRKEDAKGLKGVGDFIAERIESILYRERLLNVPPDPSDLVPEECITETKKSDISSYVPRQGSLSYFILISTAVITGETEHPDVTVDAIKHKISQIDPSFTYAPRKFVEYLRVLEGHNLLHKQDFTITLTDIGKKLGILCLKDCRLVYPAIERFIEEGYLQRLETLTLPTPPNSPPPLLPVPPPVLRLPALHWPLSPPPAETLMGEYKPEESMLEMDPLPAVSPEELPHTPEGWELLLLLDNREVRSQTDRSFLENQLQSVGVNCAKRLLSLGDMQWVFHHASSGRELMLNVIVERKNTRDLAASIMDGRFNEQQYRLLHCGCTVPIYLIEGGVRSQDMLPFDSLQKAIMTTVVNRGIYVYQSTSIDDTVVFLKGIHDIIQSWINDYFELNDTKCFHPMKINFEEFQNMNGKIRSTKLKSLWCKQLRQIPRCTPVKSMLIVKHYPTMASLLNAYDNLTTLKAKEELLKNICDKKKQNIIGIALSKSIFHFLCDK